MNTYPTPNKDRITFAVLGLSILALGGISLKVINNSFSDLDNTITTAIKNSQQRRANLTKQPKTIIDFSKVENNSKLPEPKETF